MPKKKIQTENSFDILEKTENIDETRKDFLPIAEDPGISEAFYSEKTEIALLGACIISVEAASEALNSLQPTDFYFKKHQIIFNAIKEIFEEGKPIELITVFEKLREQGKIEQAGGIEYLTYLTSSVIGTANAREYVQIIKKKSNQRLLYLTAEKIKNYVTIYKDFDEAIEKAQQELLKIISQSDEKIVEHAIEPSKRIVKNIESSIAGKPKDIGYPTGYGTLDDILLGLNPSDMIILAARPSVGKTAFSLNIAKNLVLKEKFPVLYFSLEMSASQLAMRFLSCLSEIPSQRIKSGLMTNEDLKTLYITLLEMELMPLYIDATPQITMAELKSKARRAVKKLGVKAIIVDYLQLIVSSPYEKAQSRPQEVSEISRQLKSLARELDVPVIALSQLSRAVEQRENKRPQLSDLRESGSIEQDADVVMFLYSEDYYRSLLGERVNESVVEVIVAKHRNGPIGTAMFKFRKDIGKFIEIYTEKENTNLSGEE